MRRRVEAVERLRGVRLRPAARLRGVRLRVEPPVERLRGVRLRVAVRLRGVRLRSDRVKIAPHEPSARSLRECLGKLLGKHVYMYFMCFVCVLI